MHERNKDVGLLKNEPQKDLSIGTVLKIKVKIACSFDHEWIPHKNKYFDPLLSLLRNIIWFFLLGESFFEYYKLK